MRKYLLSLVAFGLASVAMAQTGGVQHAAAMKHAQSDAPEVARVVAPYTDASVTEGNATVYGYTFYQTSLWSRGFIKFPSNEPTLSMQQKLYKDYGAHANGDYGFYSGTFVKDQYYGQLVILRNDGAYIAYNSPKGLAKVNAETGEWDLVGEWDTSFKEKMNDLAYDDKNDVLLGCVDMYDQGNYKNCRSAIYKIDYKHPESLPTYMGDLPEGVCLFAMDCDNGYLYGVCNDTPVTDEASGVTPTMTYFYKVKVEDILNAKGGRISATLVKKDLKLTGGTLAYGQSLCIDKTNHRLYWNAQPADGKGYWVELDMETGNKLQEIQLPNGEQDFGLAIPYQYKETDGVPSYVTNYTLTPDAAGATNITLTWQAPTKNVRGKALENAVTIYTIYRDGEQIGTTSDLTYTDTPAEAKTYTYRVVASNSLGEGFYNENSVFVGEDLPGAPLNVTLTAEGANATITWQAAEVGMEGGYYNKEGITYTVVRNDGKVIAENTTATTATDTEETTGAYSYTVTANSSKGKGGSATSNIVVFGNGYELPLKSSFDTKADMDLWSVIDRSSYSDEMGDGTTWQFKDLDKCVQYQYCGNGAKDYLVSPPVKLKKDKHYRIEYSTQQTVYYDAIKDESTTEDYQILIGKEATVEGLSTVIKDVKDYQNTYYGYTKDDVPFTVAEDGNYNIAFMIHSKAEMGILNLRDVIIREYDDYDFAIKGLEISEEAPIGKEINGRVLFTNNGRSDVTEGDYTVQVIDENDAVIGESAGVALAAGQEGLVTVKVTFNEVGVKNLRANIVCAQENYLEDNMTVNPVKVTVKEKGALNWLSVGTRYREDGVQQKNTTYWFCVITANQNFGQSFTYYPKEQLADMAGCNIMKLQLMYDGDPSALSYIDYPFYLAIAETNDHCISTTNVQTKYDYTIVYDDFVDLDAQGIDNTLTIEFEEPFYYAGDKNLVVHYKSPYSELTGGEIHWHCYITDNYSADDELGIKDYNELQEIYGFGAEDEMGDLWPAPYKPFTRFAYGDTEGIGEVSVKPATGNTTIYDLKGQCVKTDIKGLQPGVYVIGGKKVVVK